MEQEKRRTRQLTIEAEYQKGPKILFKLSGFDPDIRETCPDLQDGCIYFDSQVDAIEYVCHWLHLNTGSIGDGLAND